MRLVAGRRGILVAALGGYFAANMTARAQQTGIAPPALNYDTQTGGPAPIPPAERGLQAVMAVPWFKVSGNAMAIEGPAFDRQGNLFFCDASGGRVLCLTPERKLSTVLTMDLNPGGLAIHRDGRLFIAALDIPNGIGAVMEVRPDGSGLRAVVPPEAGYMPNDLVFDAQGGLYFSDFRGTSTDPRGGIYYVVPGSSGVVAVLPRIAKANGVALSPDGRVLWATEFGANRLHRVELADAITATPLGTAVPYYFTGPAPDSMRVDADGNVYVAIYGQGRVLAFNRNGIPIGQVLLSGREDGHNLLCTNMAFRPGSNEVLIVASDSDGGQGTAILQAGAFAMALPLYSHQ
jgi:lactonase